MSETTTTETHALNCDSRLGYQCTCAPQPEPDASGEWHYVETETSAEIVIGQFVLRAHWWGVADGNEVRAIMAEIVSNDNAVPKLVAALEDLVRQLPNDERLADFNLDLAESALALMKGRE